MVVCGRATLKGPKSRMWLMSRSLLTTALETSNLSGNPPYRLSNQVPCFPTNHVEAKPLCNDHAPEAHSSPGQEPQLGLDKAAAALEAKADEKGVPGKKPVVGTKGKKAVGLTTQKPLVGKEAAATKKPAAEKPAERKPTTEEKKPVA